MSSRRRSRKKQTASPAKGSGSSRANDDGTQVDWSPPRQRRRKKRRKAATAIPGPVYKQDFKKFVLASIKIGVPGLLAEFEEIQKQTAFDDKNPYKDVYCNNAFRIRIYDGVNSHSPHANMVPLPNKNYYICTQGPLATTVNDFWRMVFQEKCKAIVMLCNLVEGGEKKCEQYWPESGEMKYGKLTVKFMEKSEFEKIMPVTKLLVTKEDSWEKPLEVEHVHWKDWPDRGVPPADLLLWHKLAKKQQFLSPAVVHCSDGVGRTGTFVGLHLMSLTLWLEDEIKMGKQIVLDLRTKRHGAVQTDIQYLYMHRALFAFGVSRELVTEDEVKSFVDAYDALCKQRGIL